MLGMESQIGSLTVGKQADLVLLRADALNMQPLHDPVATVVLQASLANIDAVMVAGLWRKRGGQMLERGVTELLAHLRASGQRIVDALAIHQPNTPITPPITHWRRVEAPPHLGDR